MGKRGEHNPNADMTNRRRYGTVCLRWGLPYSVAGKGLRAAMAVMLTATLLLMVPGSHDGGKAVALEGTTDYRGYFVPAQIAGKYGYVSGSTLYASSTLTSDYYEYGDRGWSSSSGFVSSKPVALTHDWEVKVSASIAPLVHKSVTESVRSRIALGFSDNTNPKNVNGITMCLNRLWTSSAGSSEQISAGVRVNGLAGDLGAGAMALDVSITDPAVLTLSYSASADRLTLTYGSKKVYYTGVKSYMKASNYYLALVGETLWRNLTSPTVAQVPATTLGTKVTFSSMSLPHLTPSISDIRIYRTNGALISSDDVVSNNEVVRVTCIVRNTNTAAVSGSYKEQYPMHLKLLNNAAYPTQGFTPLVSASYPVQVNGSTITTSANGNTIDGANGIPLVLTGNDSVTVSYYARITQVGGAKVSLGQQLIEDSFNGVQQSGVTLLNEKPIKPADPDNPVGAAGTDYHYIRAPRANTNGWNNAPVGITFYPGDFNQLSVAPAGESAAALTGSSPTWTRATDTSGLTVSLSASNTVNGAVSTTGTEVIKLDTYAPTLSLDPALGTLTINDQSADASKATSGVWRLHRTGVDGMVAARTAAQVFPLTNGNGAAVQTVANIANGYYVAEDAAGNLSDVLKVGATAPPTVSRPPESIVDPDDPDRPTSVGPPVGPDDSVPAPTVTEGSDGLKHAVINETVTQSTDTTAPPFGGALTLDDAKELMAYRYAVTSQATGSVSQTTELLDAAGNPLATFPTTAVGECLIRQTTTDSQGNTTTINLTYRLIGDNCPLVRPWEPSDPADPVSPAVPGPPLVPTGPIATKPDGSQHASVVCDVTEPVRTGIMDRDEASNLLNRYFDLSAGDGSEVSAKVLSLTSGDGSMVASIDLSVVGEYLITYEVADGSGNTTTVHLTYHLVSSRVPTVTVTPDPGTVPNPQPSDDPMHPKPYPLDPPKSPTIDPDGTQHADVYDEMYVAAQEGEPALSMTGVRDLMERRYHFSSEVVGAMTERKLVVSRANGSATDAIDRAVPGAYDIVYEVADGEGNSTTVHLHYVVVAQAPSVMPAPGSGTSGSGGGNGGGSGVGDGNSSGSDPLPPTTATVDPQTGLTHALIEDTMTVRTSDEAMTPEAMARLFRSRYLVTSSRSDGQLDFGPVRLFDAAGNAVDVISRLVPGDWIAEQIVTDSAGCTTTIRVRYLVREGTVQGGMNESGGPGDNPGGASGSEAGPSASPGTFGGETGTGHANSGKWISMVRSLPQTGGIFGPCPIHIMFVLIMVLASAYTMMRLRQETDRHRAVETERDGGQLREEAVL